MVDLNSNYTSLITRSRSWSLFYVFLILKASNSVRCDTLHSNHFIAITIIRYSIYFIIIIIPITCSIQFLWMTKYIFITQRDEEKKSHDFNFFKFHSHEHYGLRLNLIKISVSTRVLVCVPKKKLQNIKKVRKYQQDNEIDWQHFFLTWIDGSKNSVWLWRGSKSISPFFFCSFPLSYSFLMI